MKYEDGTAIQAADPVSISESHQGKVIASMGTGQYLAGQESWGYLGQRSHGWHRLLRTQPVHVEFDRHPRMD